MRLGRLLAALMLAASTARASPRAETEAATATHAPADEAASALPSPDGNATAAPIMVTINYTFTVFNSDCPCKRSNLRYCTWFRRQHVRDGWCYPISHYAKSTRVQDPLVSKHNRLECRMYTGLHCDGVALEMTFVDNTRCREPVGEGTIGYRSFACHHVG